jgi:hypothetical protein
MSDHVDDICMEALKEDLPRLMEQIEFERKLLSGKIPMPKLPPLRSPIVYFGIEEKPV